VVGYGPSLASGNITRAVEAAAAEVAEAAAAGAAEAVAARHRQLQYLFAQTCKHAGAAAASLVGGRHTSDLGQQEDPALCGAGH
jgi:type IV secretory pathway TrbL component